MNNKKIVIFDLDGTLLNTLQDLTDSTNFVLNSCDYPQRTLDEVRDFVGNGVLKLIERAVPKNATSEDIQNCLRNFKEHYKNNMFNKTAPYNGIIEMLKNLNNGGYKTAVVSNKFDSAVKDLCCKYFGNLIDFSAGENELAGIRKKPAPDTILKVLQKFELSQKDAIYVGDSEVDIQTAKNANIDCISVLWGFKSKEFLQKNGSRILISKPDEIFRYL